jgi:archaetidylinositol phosphate synthase
MTGKDQPAKAVLRAVPLPRTWDARAARWLVTPLVPTRVTPNHLTTLRLLIGVAGAFYLARGDFLHVNIGAFLIVLSNFVDHTDGELARISGKTSRIGHFYDLAADALVTILLFLGMGWGLGAAGHGTGDWRVPPAVLGGIAGVAVAVIFFLRMRIEEMAGKAGTQQAFVGGFETEDVLYLLPIVTLTGVASPFVLAASIGAPVFAAWVVLDYWRVMRRNRPGKDTHQAWISR